MQEDMIYVGFSRAAFLFPMQQLKNKHCHHIKKKGKKKKKGRNPVWAKNGKRNITILNVFPLKLKALPSINVNV